MLSKTRSPCNWAWVIVKTNNAILISLQFRGPNLKPYHLIEKNQIESRNLEASVWVME